MSKKEKKKKVNWGEIIFKGFWIFVAIIMVLALLTPLVIEVINFFTYRNA